jgi:hypothetical protein
VTDELAPVKYAREFYDLLAKDAIVEPDGTLLVWRGRITEAFKELGATSKYYTPVRAILVKTGAITIVEAGSRNKDSIVVLNDPLPGPAELAPILAGLDLTGTRPGAKVWADVERRLSALEGWRETVGGINIAEALRDLEQRLASVEKLVKPR